MRRKLELVHLLPVRDVDAALAREMHGGEEEPGYLRGRLVPHHLGEGDLPARSPEVLLDPALVLPDVKVQSLVQTSVHPLVQAEAVVTGAADAVVVVLAQAVQVQRAGRRGALVILEVCNEHE